MLSRILAWPGGGGASAEETRQWLYAHGLGPQDYEPLGEAFDALRDAGTPSLRALELTLAAARAHR